MQLQNEIVLITSINTIITKYYATQLILHIILALCNHPARKEDTLTTVIPIYIYLTHSAMLCATAIVCLSSSSHAVWSLLTSSLSACALSPCLQCSGSLCYNRGYSTFQKYTNVCPHTTSPLAHVLTGHRTVVAAPSPP